MKFKDLLLKEKDLADLEMDLRLLKDRQKNVPKNHKDKSPAEQGEIAAKLDDAIEKLEAQIKKKKSLKESNLMEIDDSNEYWEYQRKKRALNAELKNYKGRNETLLNKILKYQADNREQKKKNPKFIASNSSTIESLRKEHYNMSSAIIKLEKQRNKMTEDYQNKIKNKK
ncbi:hypothetical protein M0Q97_09270 [Candidatus Dojkabacteria bacterium]|jgi:hypothetical protein|nr:hypothetical protein [Candidatus Dojkabacteria bacterium]